MRNTSGSVLPIPENAFFEQAVFNQDLSQGLLELARLSLELLDLVRGGLTRRVAGEPFLARLQELLRPTVVQVLIDPFLVAELSNAVLATQAFQHDTDFLFSGMMRACGSANIPDCLFSALRYALARLSHRCSSAGYDEPAILSYAISSFCPTSADGLHHNYEESFDGRTVEQTRSIDIRTLQQTGAKATPHVFRLPTVQKICYKVRETTLDRSVQCQPSLIPAGNASPSASSRGFSMAIASPSPMAAPTSPLDISPKTQVSLA